MLVRIFYQDAESVGKAPDENQNCITSMRIGLNL